MTTEYTFRGKSLSRIAEFIQAHDNNAWNIVHCEKEELFTLIKDVVILELSQSRDKELEKHDDE